MIGIGGIDECRAIVGSNNVTTDGTHTVITIDFEDQTDAPLFIRDAKLLSDEYLDCETLFWGPDGLGGNDGGVVINDLFSTLGITGHSPTKILIFDIFNNSLENGGIAQGPETIRFLNPVKGVRITAGHAGSGTINLTCETSNLPISDQIPIGSNSLQQLEVRSDLSDISSCTVSFNGFLLVLDDLVITKENPFPTLPIPDIKANASDGPLGITKGTPITVEAGLNPGSFEDLNADWFLIATSPIGQFCYNLIPEPRWLLCQEPINPTFQGPLRNIEPKIVLDEFVLPVIGDYVFSFTIAHPNGISRTDEVMVLVEEETVPDISVGPSEHDFGEVTIGDESAPQTFTVSNKGELDLIVGDLDINDTLKVSSAFIIQEDNCSNQRITPDDSCTVNIVFAPSSEGEKNANLSLPSNDPDTPTLVVPLKGNGIAACNFIFTPDPEPDENGTIFMSGSGGSGTVEVSTEADCEWSAVSNAEWLKIDTGQDYIGPDIVKYSMNENLDGFAHTGIMTIAGKEFKVVQGF